MARDDRRTETYDLTEETAELLDRAVMVSAVVRDRLQTITEFGPSPGQETDFSPRTPDYLDLQSEQAFELACEFVQSQGDSSFTVTELREFLLDRGADEGAVAKQTAAVFAKWRDRMLAVAGDQRVRAQWAGPKLLGRGKYALATGGGLDLTRPFRQQGELGALQPPVRLGDPSPEIWGESAAGLTRQEASRPAPTKKTAEKKEPTPEEADLAYAVVSALTTLRNITQRLTPAQITEIINDSDWLSGSGAISDEDTNAAIRQLQRQGIVTKTGKRTAVLKVGLTSKSIRSLLRTEEGRAEVTRLLRSGGKYTADN